MCVSVQCPGHVLRNAFKSPLLQVMEMEVATEGTRTTMEETRAMEAIKITEEVDLETIRTTEAIKTTEEVVVDMGATKTIEAVKTTEEVEVDLEVDTGTWYRFLRKVDINSLVFSKMYKVCNVVIFVLLKFENIFGIATS